MRNAYECKLAYLDVENLREGLQFLLDLLIDAQQRGVELGGQHMRVLTRHLALAKRLKGLAAGLVPSGEDALAPGHELLAVECLKV